MEMHLPADRGSSTEERLREYLACQAAVSRAALAESAPESFAGSVARALAEATGARAVAVFVPRGDYLDVLGGAGWLPHVQPQSVPGVTPVGQVPRRLAEVDGLAGARLLRAHDLSDGLVCDVVLPRGDTGLLAVFGGDLIDDPALPDLIASCAELVGSGLQRRHMADELAANERRLREAQELAHVGSYDWDILTDTNVWSDELYRIYGAEPGAFNASYDEFIARIHPDDREKVMQVHRQAFETLEPYRMTERIVRTDGSVRTLATTGEVVVDDSGTPVRMRGICIDMTDRYEAERRREALDRAEERRRQAFQINDSVVQGLTAVLWAIDEGVVAAARTAAADTLQRARGLMQGLLEGDTGEDLDELTRTESPANPVRTGWEPPDEPPTVEQTGPVLRVVIADDSDDLRLLLRLQLTAQAGYDLVGEAATGPEATEIVATTQPDLILLDLAMPGGNGLDAIPEIRRVSPDTRIVVVSGFSHDHLGRRALAAGAHAYVEKGGIHAIFETLGQEFPQLIGPQARARANPER